MRSALFDVGAAMSGPMRVEVGQDIVPDKATIYTWPIASPPANYELDYASGQQFGKSSLVADPTDAEALRALAAQVVADASEKPGLFFDFIPVEPRGYVFATRDDLPFTDRSTGLWAPPQ
jgi:hypothetical protein